MVQVRACIEIARRALAVLCVAALAAAGCSDGDSGGEVDFDHGVDPASKVIRVGVNAELSGPFRFQSERIVQAHLAYWEWLNDRGGVSGWTVEPIVLDNGYALEQHLANYEVMSGQDENGVVMFAMSAGTPTTLATVNRLAEDSMAALPLSYYSGWSDPSIGGNVFEVLASYCVEAMNAVTYMAENYGNRAALVSVPGSYGGDGAQGFKTAAAALGVEVVYDGEGAAIPGLGLHDIGDSIAASGADWVWLATDPGTTYELMNATMGTGFDGQWSGHAASWSPWIAEFLAEELGANALERFTVSSRTTPWDDDGPQGMQEMIEAMRQYRPGAPFDDAYVAGWILGYAATAILEQAIASADLTRAGVLEAAGQTTVDFKGLAPNHTWSGDPNSNIMRSTYLLEVSPHEQMDDSLTELGTSEEYPGLQAFSISQFTVSDEDATTGYTLIKGPYTSEIAEDWSYQPCAEP